MWVYLGLDRQPSHGVLLQRTWMTWELNCWVTLTSDLMLAALLFLLSCFKFTNSKWPSEILGLTLHTSKDPNSRSLSLSATLAQSSPCCLVSMPCEYYHALFYLSSLMIVPEVCLVSIIRRSRDSPAKALALSGGCHSQCRPGEGLWCC